MHARAHTGRKRARAHLRFVIEGIMQQFEPFQPGFWDSQDFNWILYDWTHIPLPNVHMNQPSSLFYNFETIFFSLIMSVNFYKYCHIIICTFPQDIYAPNLSQQLQIATDTTTRSTCMNVNSIFKSETLDRKFFRYVIGLEWSQHSKPPYSVTPLKLLTTQLQLAVWNVSPL